MIKNALNVQQRLMRHTEYNKSSGCWEWFGSKRNGYIEEFDSVKAAIKWLRREE